MTAIATSKAASAKSCVLSQEKFDAIVRHLSSPQDKVDPHFKHWVKSRHFQLADLPGLGLFKVLVIPNEGNNKEDGVKFLRVVHANQLCDILQAVHADELKHSGYKKVLDYVSASWIFPPQLASGHKDEMDAVDTDDEVEHSTFKLPSQVSNHADEQQEEEDDTGDEVEHSTFKLPSQVSNTHADEQQEEEDDGHSKATIHTAIRKKVCDNTYLAAARMAVKYNKKKGVKTQVFSVGDKVTIGIPKMDRTKTDMPRLPCEITEVFGDKVKTYTLEQCLEL
eukprot:Em0002g376a